MKVAWKTSDAGKAKIKEYTSSQKFLDKCKSFNKTEAGRAVRKRSYEKHKASILILKLFARMLHGHNSPKAIAASSFRSAAHVRNHMRRCIAGTPMRMWNYGEIWQCDHKIPRSAYNHDDPEDVKRCWSPENLQPMLCKSNLEKHTAIVPEVVQTVAKEKWPIAWGGVMPCA